MSKSSFIEGLKAGIPIALGYFFVSTGFGITAVNSGLSVFQSVLISASCVTSAGQVAGLRIITGSNAFFTSAFEMVLTQFVINLRYSLMGISLSQKTDDSFDIKRRMLCSYSITDEIFALASTRSGLISVPFFLGLSILPIVGWTLGTATGALVSSNIPIELSAVFGIAIYGMFLSIFVPPAKKDKGTLLCVLTAGLISCLIYYCPILKFISSGFSIIVSSVIASIITSLIYPHSETNV